jgi:hypothetical protein
MAIPDRSIDLSRNLRLDAVDLSKDHLGVGVSEGLLVDPPNALQRADREGVWGTEIPRMGILDLASRLIIVPFLLQGGNLGLRHNGAFLRYLFFQCFQALFETVQIMPQPDAADAGQGDNNSLFSLFITDFDLNRPGISTA